MQLSHSLRSTTTNTEKSHLHKRYALQYKHSGITFIVHCDTDDVIVVFGSQILQKTAHSSDVT